MSAFVVSKEHIDAMVSLAIAGPSEVAPGPGYWPQTFSYYHEGERHEVRLENADELGAMLWGTNALSVRTRYPDLYEGGEYPGPIGFSVDDDVYEYRYTRPRRRPNPVEGLKLINCYEYQTCEFEAWEDHPAYAFCEQLKAALVNVLPGYSDAPWEWTGERVTA